MSKIDERMGLLRDSMAREAVDLAVLAPGAHMQWLLGYCPHADERPCLLCITATGAAFLMPALNAEGSRANTDLPFFEWADADGPDGAFRRLLDDLGAAEAGAVVLDETMRADFAALVQDSVPSARRQFTESTVGLLRMRKDEDECALLRRNAAIADRAMQAGWAAMKPGMTEQDVANVIRSTFTDHGAMPLFSIVGAGGNGAFPHHHTGGTVLSEGDVVVMDLGGGLGGYSSDITRVAVLGTPPEGFEEVHAIVERAVQAAMVAARPGVMAKEVDAAARSVITEAGYEGDVVVMDLGGGLGGYSSDITRVAVLGTPPEGFEEVHAIVERAVQAAMVAARPGVMAKEVDAAARSVITEAGYGENFVHRTGHGLGVQVHEPPYLTSASETVLETGMVFSIEPGIYLSGRFGVRLEDIVILREDGPEILSGLSRDPARP